MFGKIKEECGVFGIYSMEKNEDVANITRIGISCLQHRGEESCGIAVNDGGLVYCEKDIGLVNDVFTPERLAKLPTGKMAIGHVRYSTTGAPRKENAQPIVKRYAKGNICVVHNGNLINTEELRNELEMHGAIFNSTSDTEVICSIIARERVKTGSIEEAVINATKYLKGAYSLVVMSSRKLIAVRDPNGFRPLCMGRLGNDYVFASESCALDVIGAKFERDINPGEIITIYNNEIKTQSFRKNEKDGFCIFEYVYFARPDSNVDGMNVHKFRELAGKYLAEQAPVDADFVAGVPDSGLDAALGYSKYSKIPYDIAFVKSKYIGRTFIQSTQSKRKSQVALKLNPIPSTVKDKKIILVDDSLVRGTTITRIIKILRRAGAKEIHLRIASPEFFGICYFGTDITDKNGLIATQKSVEEIRQMIDADSLEYLSLENLRKIAKESDRKGFCEGCFTCKYPIEVPKEIHKDTFEKIF
ncbi:MAG: amidophosphoribosyltransferase [Clostridia bacterium]|nr:amidophosphoribosyltransferase [Clostridia bacterium]